MAWNRGESKNQRGSRRGRRGVPFVLLVAFVPFALVCGVAVWWWASNCGETAAPKPKAPRGGGVITEVKPAAAPTASNPSKAKPSELTKEEKRLAEIRQYEKMFGTNMPPGVAARVYFLKNPPQNIYKIKNEYGFLRHPAERDIASLLAVEPGSFMLDKPKFGESFNKDFLASVLDKSSEPTDDDDEDTRAVKVAVGELKREIAEIQKAEGKLPSEIMNEHAAVLYELGQLENMLEQELVKARSDPEMSDKDVEDLFAAANKLRKERGLAEWKVPDFSKRSIRLQRKLMKRSKQK